MSAALEFENFTFSYPAEGNAEKPLIGPLSASIEEGAFTLITGATGCGKTTLLRCCKPELAPTGTKSGIISMFGRDAASLSAHESAQTVGFVTQNADNQIVCSQPWHELAFGLENLATPQDAMRRRVAEIAHFFGMNSWLHQDVNDLSGGQKQLLALASVLACTPRLLLLDEPTSQLDPVAAHSLAHALFRVNRELGITVVATTHAPELMAPYATQRLKLESGTLKEAPLPTPKAFVPAAHNAAATSIAAEKPRREASPQAVFTAKAAAKPKSSSTVLGHAALALHVNDVSFRYERKSPFVLRSCNLEVEAGTLHAIVGANGCGKSTLLALAAGTLRPERGRVKSPYRSSQGFIPQDPKTLFVCDSVAEELREWQRSCGCSNEDIRLMLEKTGLAGLEASHPYDLSGGQQQLLAFAKVLLTHPKLLLLDEATKGLDAQTKLAVANLCRELTRKGTTIVLATHDLSFAACAADTITMLFDGEDACTEAPAKFFQNNLFYRATENEFTRAWETQR